MWIFQKLANGLRLASINAVEVHSKQTSTDLNATQKHANGLGLPSINSVEVHLNQPQRTSTPNVDFPKTRKRLKACLDNCRWGSFKTDFNGPQRNTETCKRLRASFNKQRWGSPQPTPSASIVAKATMGTKGLGQNRYGWTVVNFLFLVFWVACCLVHSK